MHMTRQLLRAQMRCEMDTTVFRRWKCQISFHVQTVWSTEIVSNSTSVTTKRRDPFKFHNSTSYSTVEVVFALFFLLLFFFLISQSMRTLAERTSKRWHMLRATCFPPTIDQTGRSLRRKQHPPEQVLINDVWKLPSGLTHFSGDETILKNPFSSPPTVGNAGSLRRIYYFVGAQYQDGLVSWLCLQQYNYYAYGGLLG